MNARQLAEYIEWFKCQIISFEDQIELADKSRDELRAIELGSKQIGILSSYNKLLEILKDSAQLPAK